MAAHAVIRQGLINLFWFRELLTNNSIQPRRANGIEGRRLSFAGMGPLIVSFVKSAGLLRRITVTKKKVKAGLADQINTEN